MNLREKRKTLNNVKKNLHIFFEEKGISGFNMASGTPYSIYLIICHKKTVVPAGWGTDSMREERNKGVISNV